MARPLLDAMSVVRQRVPRVIPAPSPCVVTKQWTMMSNPVYRIWPVIGRSAAQTTIGRAHPCDQTTSGKWDDLLAGKIGRKSRGGDHLQHPLGDHFAARLCELRPGPGEELIDGPAEQFQPTIEMRRVQGLQSVQFRVQLQWIAVVDSVRLSAEQNALPEIADDRQVMAKIEGHDICEELADDVIRRCLRVEGNHQTVDAGTGVEVGSHTALSNALSGAAVPPRRPYADTGRP